MIFTFLTWGAPLWAATGIYGMTIGWGLALLRALLLFGTPYALLVRTGLPTFTAAYAWRAMSSRMHLSNWPVFMAPALSTALFIAYNGLNLNALYTLYWVAVPVLFALLPAAARASVLMRSFVTSMVAHMVGSLIVLYAGVTIGWFALMPVVLFERMVSTFVMSGVAYGVKRLARMWSARTV